MSRFRKKPTRDAEEILHARYFEREPQMLDLLGEEREQVEIAQQIYDLRTAAGLTQRELAARVGTTASVICRLEDANYDRYSLTMLRRIAAALNSRVMVRFWPAAESGPRTARHRRKVELPP